MLADRVLYSGVACIVDLVVKEGLINLDLADVKSVLSGMGTAMMGTGEASGEQRAVDAARAAVVNPLLDDITLRGAKSLLLSISGGSDLTLFEVHDAVDYVREQLDTDANIIFGATLDESLVGRIRVSIVASGMARSQSDTLAVHGPRPNAHLPPMRAAARTSAIAFQRPSAATASRTPQPAHDPARRDTWQAPGDVVIRDEQLQRPGQPTRAATARTTVRPPAMADPCRPSRIFRPLRNASTGPKPATTAAPARRSRHVRASTNQIRRRAGRDFCSD